MAKNSSIAALTSGGIFSENVRLVWSGPIFNEMADNTAPVIHEMVNSAKKTITIIGYWLWDEGNVEEIINKHPKTKK